MHMKYLLFAIDEFLSVYLIFSARKLTTQMEVKFKCRPKREKIQHYFLSVVLLCIHIIKYCYCCGYSVGDFLCFYLNRFLIVLSHNPARCCM